MTIDEVIAQVVAATVEALNTGRLSTLTPVETVVEVLGLDAFRDVEEPAE